MNASDPVVIEQIRRARNKRGKNLIIVSGNTGDLMLLPAREQFTTLSRLLSDELKAKFICVRMDSAAGLRLTEDTDKPELCRAFEIWLQSQSSPSANTPKRSAAEELDKLFAATRSESLASLVLLAELSRAVEVARRVDGNIRPLCVLMDFAGAVLPAGELGKLPELDRMRVVSFVGWAQSPEFIHSNTLVLLITETRAEINNRVLALPAADCVEVSLPSAEDRGALVDSLLKDAPARTAVFGSEYDATRFVGDTAGLKLSAVETLVEAARRSSTALCQRDVLAQINAALEAELGGIIRLNMPAHRASDVVGNAVVVEALEKVFRRCDKPETAVPAVLVSGPNGGGKTFIMEAMAADAGRVVIELAGLRGSYFGETDKFFELLKFHVEQYGRVIIMVDEAHTAFGSVHKSDTHETEKRLAGNIIKMMGDRRLYGKVLWCLMTSRPDELDPDVKSRAPIQIPIFDPVDKERDSFVQRLFASKKIVLTPEDRVKLLAATLTYSARDLSFLIGETLSREDKNPLRALEDWGASKSIMEQRRLQTLIALRHCSYPKIIPAHLSALSEQEVSAEIASLRILLGQV